MSILESHKIKMAADGNNERMMGIRGMERAQMLWQVMQDVRRREEGLGSFSPSVPTGRVGIVPWDLTGRSLDPKNMIWNLVERQLGGLSTWSGRVRSRSLPPPSPQLLKDIPTVWMGRFQHVSPLRHSNTLPWCLQPHGRFSSPQIYPLRPQCTSPLWWPVFPQVILLCASFFSPHAPVPAYEPPNPWYLTLCLHTPFQFLYLFWVFWLW